MTYLEFHLIFNLPILIILGWLVRKRMTPDHWKWIGVVLLIVIVFTTVWDNLAVARNIWNFDESRVLFRIGYLPVEEYFFFVFATLEVCFLSTLLLRFPAVQSSTFKVQSSGNARPAGTGVS